MIDQVRAAALPRPDGESDGGLFPNRGIDRLLAVEDRIGTFLNFVSKSGNLEWIVCSVGVVFDGRGLCDRGKRPAHGMIVKARGNTTVTASAGVVAYIVHIRAHVAVGSV